MPAARAELQWDPVAVMWEVMLARADRVNLRRDARGFFDDLFTPPSNSKPAASGGRRYYRETD